MKKDIAKFKIWRPPDLPRQREDQEIYVEIQQMNRTLKLYLIYWRSVGEDGLFRSGSQTQMSPGATVAPTIQQGVRLYYTDI